MKGLKEKAKKIEEYTGEKYVQKTMKKKKTNRGFALIEFNDSNDIKCNIQKSSSAMENKIWLGAEQIGLKHFKAYEGWKDVELINTVGEHFLANNRMHLNQKQAEKLIKVLKRFVKTGEI